MKQFSLILALILSQLSAGAQIITTFAGNGNDPFGQPSGDGLPATSVSLIALGICADIHGNIFLTDPVRNTIRKVDTQGIISTVAGSGMRGYNGDGIPASGARFNFLSGSIDVDVYGNLYIADSGRLRKITAATGQITTIAGNGIMRYSKDTSIAANVSVGYIGGVKVAADGSVYFIDGYRGDSVLVRKISPSGALITVAGRLNNPTLDVMDGEGGAATAAYLEIYGIALDKLGNLYLGCTAAIKKVTTDGVVRTIVGDGVRYGPYNGEGAARSVHIGYASSLAFDSRGNLFFSEPSENRVRVVYPVGRTATHVNNAGYGRQQYSGDGGLSQNAGTEAGIFNLAVDPKDNLYLLDGAHIRKITPIPGLGIDLVKNALARLFPNPASSFLQIVFAQPFTGILAVYNSTGQLMAKSEPEHVSTCNQPVSALPAGTYFLRLTNAAGQSQFLPFVKE